MKKQIQTLFRSSPYFILLLAGINSGNTLAQEKKFDDLIYSFGISLPSNDFGDINLDNDRAGNAGKGVMVGLEKRFPMSKPGLSFLTGIDIALNPFASDAKDIVEEDLSSDEEVKFSSYFNIPLRGGIEYRATLSENADLFINGGLNLGLLKKTRSKKSGNYAHELYNRHPLSMAFGAFIGVGTTLKGKTSIGVTHFLLGKHRIKGEWERGGDSGRLTTHNTDVAITKLFLSFPLRN